METYKIGNQITGIIRAFAPGILGNEEMQYANQPYTIIDGVSAQLTFDDITSNIKDSRRVLYYNISNLDEIKISDVKLTDKIMNLIFPKSETKLAYTFENNVSDENNQIFLNTIANKIYEVFIYDKDLKLVKYYSECDLNDPLLAPSSNTNYLIFYSYEQAKAFALNQNISQYISLDLQITGNIDNNTTTMYMHIDKCGIEIDRSLYLSNEINSVDLTFHVIHDNKYHTNNYITIK